MGISGIDMDRCTGCGECYEDCPMDVIRFDVEAAKPFIAYPEDCVVCFQCVTACPVGAVSVSGLSPRELVLLY
jgi:NAD-dependent dihydropyrimidine dehydrogenase PreA subunit